MATNLRLLDNNLLFGTGVTVTTSSAFVSLPATHVLDANRNKVWRANGTIGTLVFDLGAAQNVTALGLVSSSLGTAGTVIIQANSSDSWGAPAYNSGVLNPSTTQTGVQVFFFANKFYRYWRLVLEGIPVSGTGRNSAQSGTFSIGNTWTGGTPPQGGDLPAILNTHTVVLDQSISLGTDAGVAALNINSGGTATCPGTWTLHLTKFLQADGLLSVDGILSIESDVLYTELGVAWLGTYTEFERSTQYGWDMELIPQANTGYAVGGAPYAEERNAYRAITLQVEHMSEYWTVNTLAPIMENVVGKKDVILVLFPDSTTSLGANTNFYGRIEDQFAFRETEAVFRCGIDLHFRESI